MTMRFKVGDKVQLTAAAAQACPWIGQTTMEVEQVDTSNSSYLVRLLAGAGVGGTTMFYDSELNPVAPAAWPAAPPPVAAPPPGASPPLTNARKITLGDGLTPLVGDFVKVNKKAPAALVGIVGKMVDVSKWGECVVDFATYNPKFPDVFGTGDRVPVDPKILERATDPRAADKPAAEAKAEAPPVCSFCGSDKPAATGYTSGLRCQAEPWSVCYAPGCAEAVVYHTERLQAGLFDTPETRAATRQWVIDKRAREEREARLARLAAMVRP